MITATAPVPVRCATCGEPIAALGDVWFHTAPPRPPHAAAPAPTPAVRYAYDDAGRVAGAWVGDLLITPAVAAIVENLIWSMHAGLDVVALGHLDALRDATEVREP